MRPPRATSFPRVKRPDAIAAIKKLYRNSWAVRAGGVPARENRYQTRILADANQRNAVRRERGEDIPCQ